MRKLLFLFCSMLLTCALTSNAQSADPSVSSIQFVQNSGCIDSVEAVVVTLKNNGSQTIDLSISPIELNLHRRGPNGNLTYTDTLNSGFLTSTNSSLAIFSNVIFNDSGCYALNTTINFIGVVQTNLANDSLANAIVRCRDGFELNASINHILCHGDSTGSVSLQSTGSAGMVSYSIAPSAPQGPAGTFSGLNAGNYIVTAVDANNCITTSTITITEPPALQITNISNTIPSCVPGNDATMTVNVSGGTPMYVLTNGINYQASNIFFNQGAGWYFVTVTDANGCTAGSSAIIQTPATPTWASVTSSDVICFGDSSGSISASVLPGTNPIINVGIAAPVAFPTLLPATNLPAGNYTIQAVDGNGCAISASVTIGTPPLLQITNISSTSPSCLPGNDGTATVTANGGTGALAFLLLPSSQIPQGAPIFTGLTNGNYLSQVVDMNGCMDTASFSLSNTSTVNFINVNSSPATCGLSDGSLTVSVTAYSAVTYSISPDPNAVGATATGIFTSLPSGTYTISATDANNCTAVTEVRIDEVSAISFANILTDHVSCHGGSDGKIIVQTNASAGNFTLTSLPAISSSTPGVFSNLATGTYTIRLTDSNNCSRDTLVTVLEPALLQFTNIQKTDVDCHGDASGSISVSTTGGTGTNFYSLTPSFPAIQLQNTFQNVQAGNYIVTVTDANNCTLASQINITEPPQLSFIASTINAACSTSASGQINVQAQGGTGNYLYGINQNPGTISPNISNLVPGNYTVKVSDSLGCEVTNNYTIAADSIDLRVAARINESCEPGGDGSLVVYGFPSDTNYLYSIDSSNWQGNGEFKDLSNNNYQTFLINTTNGCTATRTDSIRFKNDLPLNQAIVTDERCFGQDNGRIVAKNKDYNYRLVPAAGSTADSGIISNIPPGLYTLIGEKTNGCFGERIIEVAAADSLWISFESTRASNVHCYGSVNFAAMGGANNLSYSLSPNAGRNLGPGSYDGLCWGDYTLTAKDDLGCTVSKKITIEEDRHAPRNMFHHFKVYPNPAQDRIWLASDYLFEYEVSLINLTGQCTQTKFVHDKIAEIDVSHLAPGMYILRFNSVIDHFERKILIGE